MTAPAKYLIRAAIETIRDHILAASGNEVYLVGNTNHKRIVEDVTVIARGNESSVPAILQVAKFGDVVIHNHPSGLIEPSQPDVHVASQLGNNGVGFYIVNNDVTEIYVVVEAFHREENKLLNADELCHFLAPDGLLAQKLGGYEHRPEQIAMIQTITTAFNGDKIAIIEAGTGVGKTLAYLIPAIFWAVNNKERCAISTNTINLQEQLIKKDIPFLQSVLDLKFKAALVKGRGNYVCLRKVEDIHADFGTLTEDYEQAELQTLIQWARNSKDGSRADLNFIPKPAVWEKIAADSDTCIRTKCPHYQACFVNRARREAIHADLLIVNHHLLFADLSVRQAGGEVAVLPSYQRLILDEAHHIEDVATSYFGAGITRIGLARMFTQLHRKSKDQLKGLLHVLLARIATEKNIPKRQRLDLHQIVEQQLVPAIEDLEQQNTALMETIFQFVRARNENDFGEYKLRLVNNLQFRPDWKKSILEPAKNFIMSIHSMTRIVARLMKIFEDLDLSRNEALLSLQVEIDAKAARLDVAANTLEMVLFGTDEEHIRWIEAAEKSQYHLVRLYSSPLEVGELLRTNVYELFKTVILTSATLTVKGIPNQQQFDYLENRIGINLVNKLRRIEQVLPAPFNYQTQAIILVPLNIPDPSSREFSTNLTELIHRALLISHGRAFVLFTAYGLLNQIYEKLELQLPSAGILPLKQGSENRHQLLERFRMNKHSALFATDSFWEGVDVQGEALESVIITKLPFKVPTEPVIEARVEVIKKRGGNAFMEYTVPQAIIKFKQGFGRLIRSKTDRGSVIIFDKRVIEKEYGKIFLESLPECRIITGPAELIFNELQTFFKNRTHS